MLPVSVSYWVNEDGLFNLKKPIGYEWYVARNHTPGKKLWPKIEGRDLSDGLVGFGNNTFTEKNLIVNVDLVFRTLSVVLEIIIFFFFCMEGRL